MWDRDNIFAYTPPSGTYPPYVSINRLSNGDVEVTVRSKPTVVHADQRITMEGETVSIVVPASEWTL